MCPKYRGTALVEVRRIRSQPAAGVVLGVVSKWEESRQGQNKFTAADYYCCCTAEGHSIPDPSFALSLFLSLRVYLLSPSEYASPSSRTYAPTVGRMQAPWFRLTGCVVCAGNKVHGIFADESDTQTSPPEREEKEKKGEKKRTAREKTEVKKSLPRSNNNKVLTKK